jgi:diguanylate cyclase (GGDEF)-like protein
MIKTLEKLARTVSQAQSLEELSRPILELLHRVTQLDSTYLTTIDENAGLQHVLYARNVGDLSIPEGLDVAWSDTLCRKALEEGQFLIQDVPARWGDSEAARALGLKTYLSTPVYVDDGELYGTLCGASGNSVAVPPDVQHVLQLFARLIAQQVERERRAERQAKRADVAEQRAQDMQLIATVGARCLEFEELEPLLQTVANYFKDHKRWSGAIPFVIHDHQLRVLQVETPEVEAVISAAIHVRNKTHSNDVGAGTTELEDALDAAGWSRQEKLEMVTASIGMDLQGGILLRSAPLSQTTDSDQSLILGCSNALALSAERCRDHQLLKVANEQLTLHALHDPLTALPNRRYLVEEMARILSRVGRTGEPVYVAFVDLDGFKKINDTYGHETGDHFLQAMAARLSTTARSGDLPSRYGGDEFVLVAIGSETVSGAEEAAIADRISAAMSGEIKLPGTTLHYDGPSVGVICWQADDSIGKAADPDKLLAEADKAMYAVKIQRRSKRA